MKTNQEIFNIISDLEEYFYYKKQNPQELEPFFSILSEMHEEAKALLCQWHNITGCKNE